MAMDDSVCAHSETVPVESIVDGRVSTVHLRCLGCDTELPADDDTGGT